MADCRDDGELVTEFLLSTCGIQVRLLRQWLKRNKL